MTVFQIVTNILLMMEIVFLVGVFLYRWWQIRTERACSGYRSWRSDDIHWTLIRKAKKERHGNNLYDGLLSDGVTFEYFSDLDVLVTYADFLGFRIYKKT